MRKVYMVWQGREENSELVGVFTNFKKAKKMVSEHFTEWNEYCDIIMAPANKPMSHWNYVAQWAIAYDDDNQKQLCKIKCQTYVVDFKEENDNSKI